MSEPGSLHWRATARLIWPDARRYGSLAVVVVGSSLLALVGPIILREIIDRAESGAALSTLGGLGVLFLLTSIASQGLALLVSYLATTDAWQTANALRLQLAGHVLGLDHEFHRSHSPGELIERIDGDVTSVSDFLAVVVVRVLAAVVLVVGVVAVVSTIEWWLGAGMALYAAAVALGIFVQRNHAVDESANEMSAGAALYGGIEERLAASEDLRSNGAGPYALARFVNDTGRYVAVALDRHRAFLRLWRNLQISIVGGTVLSLVVGALGVRAGVLSVGSAFLLFQYGRRLRAPMEDISHELELVQKANGAMVRVVRLLEISSAVPDEGDMSPPGGPLGIAFERVSFDYGDGVAVIDDVSLEIEAGRSVGVVGQTGSGKTTMSRLCLRLIDASAGEIRLGDIPIRQIPLDELRRRVALIPQTVDLMAGTVRDNVTLFREATDAEVDEALGQVGLDRFRGSAMHQYLGPNGSGLSAGEGQLLALARVWFRCPDLIVLDEPTARVDPVTEERLEAAIATLFADRTVLVVAHRLSTLRHVDEIVVVDNGRVVEHGEREALTSDPTSHYHRLLTSGLELDSEQEATR